MAVGGRLSRLLVGLPAAIKKARLARAFLMADWQVVQQNTGSIIYLMSAANLGNNTRALVRENPSPSNSHKILHSTHGRKLDSRVRES